MLAPSHSAALLVAVALAAPACAAPAEDLGELRAVYEELVETNTTLSVGDCTKAARAVAARLQRAGYADADVHVIVPEGLPRQGNLVALLPGSSASAKALMLLAHLDVVEANREDWKRDPFELVEEDGYFYGRGTADDKAMAAIFVDAMLRYKREGYRPSRAIKLVLTCGEETPDTFDGAKYLVERHRDLIDAALALNEGGSGRLDPSGRRLYNAVQAGEKVYQDIRLEVTNPGGHSSRPLKENAIYRLAAALTKIAAYEFPFEINETVRAYFTQMADIEPGPLREDMRAIGAGRADRAALERVAADPSNNALMRTTCVATMLDAGHAPNGLPQRARANVNCRILPGHSQEEVRAALERVIADPAVAVTFVAPPETVSPPPPLTPEILEPIKAITEKLWPGVPVVPIMLAGATDARFLTPAGIPTYGVSGLFMDPATVRTHGLDERLGVRALHESREFLDALIRAYADAAR